MKKLVVALSAVAAACALNAAQYSWGFMSDEIQDATGSYIDGGTAMLYLGTVTFDESTGWDLSGATLLGTAGQDSSAYTFGPVNVGSTNPSSDAVTVGGAQAYTLVLLQDSGVSDLASYTGDGKYYYLETGTTGTAAYLDGTTSVSVATMKSATAVAKGDWAEAVTSSVPEPTSGLLLLLGVAGLALRRKIA